MSSRVCGGEFSLQVNMPPECEVVWFPLTGCLLGKMSAVHVQHIHFEITLKTQKQYVSAEACGERSCRTRCTVHLLNCISICYAFQCSVKVLTILQTELLSTVCSIWARLNLQSEQWIINKMSYWLIDLYTRQSGCLFCIPPTPHAISIWATIVLWIATLTFHAWFHVSLHVYGKAVVFAYAIYLNGSGDCFCYGLVSHKVWEVAL